MHFVNLWKQWLGFFACWTVAGVLSGALGYLVLVLMSTGLDDISRVNLLINVCIAGGITGVVGGGLQMRLLQPFLKVGISWVGYTMIGWMGSIPLLVVISKWIADSRVVLSQLDAILSFMAAAGFCGLLAGFGPWFAIRKRVSRSGWWLVGSLVGWIVAWVAMLGTAWGIYQESYLPLTIDQLGWGILLGSIAGLMVGGETGIALVGIFAQNDWDRQRSNPHDETDRVDF